MKRTTIFIDERLERELQAMARRGQRSVAALVREAVERYVVSSREDHAPRLRFIAAGRSGRSDVAERHEQLLFQDATPPPKRASTPRRPRSLRQRRPKPRRDA